MLDIKKIIVFLFVIILLLYMTKLSIFTRKKWQFRTYTFIILFVGLLLFTIATFLDMISPIIKTQHVYIFIRIFFTLGAIIYTVGVILWSHYTKKVIEKLEEMTLKDAMTGAFNRIGIERVYKTISESNSPFYIIVCDLDGMKKVNDKYGHLQGDKYIINTVKIIADVIGEKGYVGRVGGDEFVIVLEYQDTQQVQQILLRIKQLVDQIFIEKNTGISLGYSMFPYDGDTLEELTKVADRKMYNDKASRKIHIK